MNAQQILALNETKTAKIKMLLALGLSRKQVAELVGVNYGFVHNVYAAEYGVANPQKFNAESFEMKRSFGIEIECLCPSHTRDEIACKINNAGVPCHSEGYNHERRNHWKVVTDASVPGGFEVVSPVLQGDVGFAQLRTVSAVLVNAGCRLSKETGMHVHLGMDDIKEKVSVWKNLIFNYAVLEGTIDSFMPASRRAQNNRFCQSMRVQNWAQKIEQATTLKGMAQAITGRSRYFKLNCESYWRHKTVEFRQHSGTIEFDKIRNWVLFCGRLVEFSKKQRLESDQLGELPKFLNGDLVRFYENRRLRLAA